MTAPVIRALAARYYTDPSVYEAERERLLARTWQFAGHASQLANPGDYFAFEISGESLFCIKGRDGVVRTFYNVCQHRAHQLLSGAGSVRVLVCPYHAWTYELTGELRAGPNLAAVEGFERAMVCLTEVRTEVFANFIFVNLDDDARPMDEWFPGVRDEFMEWVPDWERLQPLEWVEVQERCNWKISVENYSECYHCARNHHTFTSGVVKPQTYDIRPQGYCLRHTTECAGIDMLTYEIDTTRPHAEEYSSWFLWPMFSFQVYPGNVLNTYHWRALDPQNVVAWRGWYTVDGGDSETIRRLAAQDRATTVEEDILLVESVQRGLKSRGYVPGPLVIDPERGLRSEHSIQIMQQWVRNALDD
ncbi:MAG: Rieske 2Fe-2S domain-containing protein [Gammaproteobacteria bacterium]|nr:Rieske 2Fe-2S domain-containing protein [Gammaproteobacteria bacterium]